MAVVEFVGQSAQDSDNGQVSTSRLINLYREPVKHGDRTRYALKSVLGREAFCDFGTVFLRALGEVDSKLYAASGSALYQVTKSGDAVRLGAIPDSEETTITGSRNNTTGNVTICADGRYFVWDGDTLTEPAAGAFSNFASVSYIGGYTVLIEKDGRRVQWSDLADPTTLPGVNFATTEQRDDNNLRAMVIGGNLWIFKERSIEIWYVTGASGASALAPVSGQVIDTGLKAFGLLAKFRAGAFFVGEDGIAYISDGTGIRPVSTTAVETAIADGDPTHCFYYEDEGHKFCVIRFQDRPAWVLDTSTGEWHERAEGAEHSAWQTVAMTKAFGKWISGDNLGELFTMARNNVDGPNELLRTAVSRTVFNDHEPFVVDKLEFSGRVGRSKLSRDPQGWIRVSKDHGATWSLSKHRSWGALGEYDHRVTYRNMGQFRQFTVELNMSDPVDIPINASASLSLS